MSETPETETVDENHVAHLAAQQEKVLIAHERLDDAFKPYRVFALADDTEEAIAAVGKDLDHHRTGATLEEVHTQLVQTKAAIIRSEAQALADSFTWDENDQALLYESQIVNLLIRVITDERQI